MVMIVMVMIVMVMTVAMSMIVTMIVRLGMGVFTHAICVAALGGGVNQPVIALRS
ncbi:hypothetical protein HY36_00445 [Hyphomonas atlantica]|uniref:Uncharacterized protein n=1 Tax=Hyphomonas atlantica TaxID=1280948 RepID=A0A059EAI8_9PROT|nr:hypothetical protein HY36_00445 [Hyphomonas atlantica]